MSILSRHRSTASLAIACLALFVAIGGVGYAAATFDGKNIINKTVAGKKLKNKTIGAGKVKSNTLGGAQIKESTLGKVPAATSADSAGSAQTAANATNAANAGALGGAPASDYLKTDARGVATAGAVIAGDGSVRSWFNRAGGPPTVNHTSDGDYNVSFPGLALASTSHIATGTVVGIFGLATVDYSGGDLHVRTFTGNLAADTFDEKDRQFTVVVHAADAG